MALPDVPQRASDDGDAERRPLAGEVWGLGGREQRRYDDDVVPTRVGSGRMAHPHADGTLQYKSGRPYLVVTVSEDSVSLVDGRKRKPPREVDAERGPVSSEGTWLEARPDRGFTIQPTYVAFLEGWFHPAVPDDLVAAGGQRYGSQVRTDEGCDVAWALALLEALAVGAERAGLGSPLWNAHGDATKAFRTSAASTAERAC